MKKFLILLITAALLLSSCGVHETGTDSDTAWELVSEAYTYAFPLVIMDATKTSSINTRHRPRADQSAHPCEEAGRRTVKACCNTQCGHRLYAGLA